MTAASEPRRRSTFGRSARIIHAAEFKAVYEARMRKLRGPLLLFSRPNTLAHHRLGLSIGRRVGPAVRRNLLKRHLREAFRLNRADLPMAAGGGYDLVVSANAHEPLTLSEYQDLLMSLALISHKDWQRRAARGENPLSDAGG